MRSMEDEHTKIPETIKEVGIHIGYMRGDLEGIRKLISENKYVTGTEFAEHKLHTQAARMTLRNDLDHLIEWRDKIVNKIALGAVVGLVLMVLALYGLEKFLV